MYAYAQEMHKMKVMDKIWLREASAWVVEATTDTPSSPQVRCAADQERGTAALITCQVQLQAYTVKHKGDTYHCSAAHVSL
jgi:hypothetical protein